MRMFELELSGSLHGGIVMGGTIEKEDFTFADVTDDRADYRNIGQRFVLLVVSRSNVVSCWFLK